MTVESYRDLKVWRMGMQLAKECYLVTRRFPKEEMLGPATQTRRAAVGIPANVAEGYGREGTGEYIHFLRLAQGSLKELETHLLLASEVEVTTPENVQRPLHRRTSWAACSVP